MRKYSMVGVIKNSGGLALCREIMAASAKDARVQAKQICAENNASLMSIRLA